MGFSKKIVTTYSKSLFQNVKASPASGTAFDLSNVSTPMSADQVRILILILLLLVKN